MIKRIKTPIKIDPCPIIESVIAFQFTSSLPSEAIFGVLFKCFQSEFGNKVEKLPLLQIPEQIRSKDPNLMFQPYFKLRDKNFLVQIGPKVISFVNVKEYLGWKEFYNQVNNYICKINDTAAVSNVTRIGLRYLNLFDFNIFEKINLEVIMMGEPLPSDQITFRTQFKSNDYQITLNIVNTANIIHEGKKLTGSMLDIDVYLVGNNINLFTETDKLIKNAHEKEKCLFFNLLDNEYLKNELNPIYGD